MKPKIIYKDNSFLLFKYGAIGVTILNRIYIHKDIYNNSPEEIKQALIIHELIHVKQQTEKIYSMFVFFFLYFVSKKYRFKMELEASIEEIKYLVANGYNLKNLISYKAKSLSGKIYFNMISYEDAYKKLADIFNIL